MEDNRKAVNRVLEDMGKDNPEVYKSAEGSGKVALNKYLLIKNDTTKVKVTTKTEGIGNTLKSSTTLSNLN